MPWVNTSHWSQEFYSMSFFACPKYAFKNLQLVIFVGLTVHQLLLLLVILHPCTGCHVWALSLTDKLTKAYQLTLTWQIGKSGKTLWILQRFFSIFLFIFISTSLKVYPITSLWLSVTTTDGATSKLIQSKHVRMMDWIGQTAKCWKPAEFVTRQRYCVHSTIACLQILCVLPKVPIDLPVTHAHIVVLDRKLQASKTCYTHSSSNQHSKIKQ